ncbi:MAG: nucleoside 2-deoxyribosyltransferase [Candidatus Moranbacteria bacterium]|nr:nucleoside 2-deoxyribosyltransferase [Candidatus Moranbacteria bacterium]
MKIYFAGSIRGGREDAILYGHLIGMLQAYGEVLTEHVGFASLSVSGEASLSERAIHDRDLGWIAESDIVVAEVTTPSLGVGYEVGRAVEMGKKILCLYRKSEGRSTSAMIEGCPDVIFRRYSSDEEAREIIREVLA